MAVPDSEFEQFLVAEDLVQQYQRRLDEVTRERKRLFWREAQFRRQQKRAGIELEKRHRTLLNLGVFPFVKGQSGANIGYQFVRGSPLAELGLPNFDCLIARLTDPLVAIFVEAKGSIQDASSAVRETLARREAAIANLDYVLSHYLGVAEKNIRLEFCILCPSTEVTEVVRAVSAETPRLIVWHAALAGEPLLKLASPPEIPDRHLMIHGGQTLNDLLVGVSSSFSCFDLWPKLHPALELGATFRVVERDESAQFATLELMRMVVASELFYLDANEQEAKTVQILELGKRIGFLEATDVGEKYRVASAGERRTAIEERAQRKWIDYALKEDLAESLEEGRLVVQQEFRRLRQGRPTLDEWR